ncbi:MAG: squalene/phytoene synthase family protein [Gammaproteobacteria bacterium]|nr:squalene/phytoene synthase family protein [Gammaproteobacteria bacterium]
MPEQYPFPDAHASTGSTAYYAIRFAPIDQRTDLCLVHAFYRSIREIPITCSDPGVALEKLNWWRQEIPRSRQFQAQHPIAKALGPLQSRLALPDDYFEPFFQTVAREIGGGAIESHVDLEAHCRQSGALLTDLFARIGGSDAKQLHCAADLGTHLRMFEIIRDLGTDLRLNRCFVPADLLQQHRLSAVALLTIEDEQVLSELLAPIATRQQQLYRNIISNLSQHSGLGPVLSMATIAERTLRIIHKDGYRQLLQQRANLTPLRKLWISWRCQRCID